MLMSQIHYKATIPAPQLPSADYITPSNAMSQPAGRKLSDQYQLDFSMSMTKVNSVFSNRVLPPSSRGQPRAMAIGHIVLRVSRTPLTNNSRRSTLHTSEDSVLQSNLPLSKEEPLGSSSTFQKDQGI